jgi:hypothetical protein
MNAVVAAVSRSAKHTLVKSNQESIRLLPGLGVDGDAHQGATVKHRSRVARDPTQPAPSPPDPRRTARRIARGGLYLVGRADGRETSRREALLCSSFLPAHGCISAARRSSR